MAKIILSYRKDVDNVGEIPTYNLSTYLALVNKGHEVKRIGQGHEINSLSDIPENEIKKYDLFLDIDCGRNKNGDHHFQLPSSKCPIPSAIRLVDSHGHPTLHRRTAKLYSHVFFAVWRRRELFVNHPSSHWSPNASDTIWFDYFQHLDTWRYPKYSFGFFGSAGGLSRADDLVSVCDDNNFHKYDVREIGKSWKRRWPRTAKAMANCRFLFNRGQKHDGPNQRVIESMLMKRPLITDRDKEDGMNILFIEGEHYLGYDNKSELANQMQWVKTEPDVASTMASKAYDEVRENHQVQNRVDQILEICLK